MAHVRQSRSDSCLGFQVKVIETFQLFPLRSEADLRSSGGRVLVSVDLASQSVTCLRVYGLGFRVWDSGFMVYGVGGKGSRFRVWGSVLRVEG